MIVTEEMVRGCHPSSPCRACVGEECRFDEDEMDTLNCPILSKHCERISKNLVRSGAELWRIMRTPGKGRPGTKFKREVER